MFVSKRFCDACGGEVPLNTWITISGSRWDLAPDTPKKDRQSPLFPNGFDGYGGRYYDLCESCTEKVLRMFSAKEEAK